MKEQLTQRLYSLTQRVCKVFIKETFLDFENFLRLLKSGHFGVQSMTEYEKDFIFTTKYEDVEDNNVALKYGYAIIENLRKDYQ